jgi:hypothetical protein
VTPRRRVRLGSSLNGFRTQASRRPGAFRPGPASCRRRAGRRGGWTISCIAAARCGPRTCPLRRSPAWARRPMSIPRPRAAAPRLFEEAAGLPTSSASPSRRCRTSRPPAPGERGGDGLGYGGGIPARGRGGVPGERSSFSGVARRGESADGADGACGRSTTRASPRCGCCRRWRVAGRDGAGDEPGELGRVRADPRQDRHGQVENKFGIPIARRARPTGRPRPSRASRSSASTSTSARSSRIWRPSRPPTARWPS